MSVGTRRWLGWFLGAACTLWTACASPKPDEADQALACISPSDALATESEHGFMAPVPIRTRPTPRPDAGTRVVYLNRKARTYVPGIDDAQAGASSVLTAQGLSTATVPGWKQGDEAWRDVRT